MMSAFDHFDLLLNNAIDEELGKYGNFNRALVYQYLEKKYGVTARDISSNIVRFEDSIHELYGIGYDYVIKSIMRNLFGILRIRFEENDKWRMTDYIKLARALSKTPE